MNCSSANCHAHLPTTALLSIVLGVAVALGGELPELNWAERSDWINVKTDVSPAAIGDGVADDTAAIQAALNTPGTGVTVYFPPGTYKITDTLHLIGGNSHMGLNLIGHGRTTRLTWYGAASGNMLHFSGNPYSRYEGLTLDGRNIASAGFHGYNTNRFETSIRFKHMAFRNLTGYGVWAVKEPSPIAMAETSYENCIFDTCGRGLSLDNFNDYNHTLTGCDFLNCGYGIYATRGTFYARDCYFTNSITCDIYSRPEHACSVRRCKSVRSAKFIDNSNAVSPFTIQDCYVDGWTGSDGAITHGSVPTLLLFNNRFVNPPDALAPVRCSGAGIQAVVGTNTASTAIVSGATLYNIPAGFYPPRLGSALGSNVTTFVNTNVTVPAIVFDAKVDFGAVGNGSANDTVAIQNTINAARTAGNGALAYFPLGTYRVTNTIEVTGSNYTVGGCGYFSRIRWDGPTNGTTFRITNPDRLHLENLMIGHHDLLASYPTLLCANDVEIIATTNAPCTLTLEGLELFGKYQSKPWRQGLYVNGLGTNCTVILNGVSGNLRFHDSGAATILGNLTYEGAITIDDTASARTGLLGFQTRLSTINSNCVIVRDNASAVFSDYYTEQGFTGVSISGNTTNPAGRIVMQNPKSGYNNASPELLNSSNYLGHVFYLGCQFYADTPTNLINQTGPALLNVTLVANLFYRSRLIFTADNGVLSAVGNRAYDTGGVAPPDSYTSQTLTNISLAFDDLQRLGLLDLKLNFSHVPALNNPTITVNPGPHGSVTPPGPIELPFGGATNFVVIADPYYRIATLTTNGVLVPAAAGTTTFTSIWTNVQSPSTLAVTFAANVTPNTGTPEWWLAQFGWTTGFSAAATNDVDGDGIFTWQEYLADTDPTNAASVLRITGIMVSGNSVTIGWQGGTSATQVLERRSNLTALADQWLPVFSNPPPTYVTTNYTDVPPPLPASFYRIRAQR